MPLVSIVMGSDSDREIMLETSKILKKFDISHEITITSAHRSPEKTERFCKELDSKGVLVVVAGAGSAAHLAGVIASRTSLPVIGVPIPSSPLHGLDSLFSTVQMPSGVPVATMALGKAGAKNAGIFAAQLLSLSNPKIKEQLSLYKEDLAKEVEEKDKAHKVNEGT